MVKAVAVKEENDWKAEDDMRTLMRAEVIKKDKKRMASARRIARKKLEEMKRVIAG